jgi:hypothetical protein
MSERLGTNVAFSPWDAICLDCRTALIGGASRCDQGAQHRVVGLMTRAGQEALLDEVWAAPDDGPPGLLGDPRPCGAPDLPFELRRSPRRGRVEGRPALSPLGREPCLAYGLALLTNRPAVGQRDVLWREAATVGFNVRLDDGGTVRVPRGRIRFEVDRHHAYYAPRSHAAEHLPGALGIRITGELDFIPFDEALEDVLRPGDRVELLGHVVLREDTTVERPFPRAPAPTVLVPAGTPAFRRLD